MSTAAASASPSGAGPSPASPTASTASPTSAAPSLSRCLVYCRQRPSNKRDFQDGAFPLLRMEGNRVYVKNDAHYDYDGTFDADSTQEQVFTSVAVPCIQHAFKGFCSALLCYGQTGTGKSYTMCNMQPEHEGIIPRAAQHIYDEIDRQRVQRNRTFTVVGQFVQIYRDHLGDLMTSDGKDRVDIYYDANDGVTLPGCSFHTLASAEEFMAFYREGNARRVVTATAMNAESSRGHTAMVIWIASEDPDDPMAGRMRGKITFIDLAGYERFSKTGITSANPIMKDEAKTINASLLALGHVVSSLSSGSRHIPWRDSKLTRILQDSIGGRSRTSIILTVGPSSDHLYETTNTLQFGLRAMAVKVQAKVSVTVDYEKLANKLMGELSARDERIGALELQIASRDAERQQLLERYQQDRALLEEKFAQELQTLAAGGATEEQIRNLKEVYEVEVQNLQEQQEEEISYQDEEHGREISKLIQSQKHQEARSIAEMKLSQEHIIEEFQRKLESARGGTNDDLLRALQQVSEKDVLLTSRATETARLHQRLEALAAQVRALGGDPDASGPPPNAAVTYVDVAQMEEMRAQLQAEAERHRAKAADLRMQLDRVSLICNERMEENGRLRAALEEARGEGGGAADALPDPVARRDYVDAEELTTLQLSMQADIDELNSIREDLMAEIHRLRARERENSVRSGSVTSTTYSLSPRPSSGLGLNTSAAGGAAAAAAAEADSHLESQGRIIQVLSAQLSEAKREKFSLAKRVSDLERFLREEHPGELEAAFPSSGSALEQAQAQATAQAAADPDALADPVLLDGALGAKEAYIDAQQELLLEQERRLAAARAAEEYHVGAIAALRDQLEALGLQPQERVEEVQPVAALPIEEYAGLLAALRRENRALAHLLLARPAAAAAAATPSDEQRDGAPSVEDLLAERDALLQLKDEMLLDKVSVAQYVVKVGARLIGQMQSLGLTPCCTLPDSFMDLAAAEAARADDSQAAARQRELEEQLRREQEEKERMNRLLRAFTAEREMQAAALNETAAKNKELEERELRVVEAYCRMAEEKCEKEQFLEEEARRATQELMEMQARAARRDSERKGSSVLDRLFGKLLE